MKYIIIITLFFYAKYSSALVIWPGASAPCNTTLEACADGSPVGEVIEIHTNGPINESVTTTKGTSLIAGVGYKPVFAAGNHVEIAGTANSDLTVTISGLTFLRGRIAYNAHGFAGTITTLNITNNHIADNSVSNESIRIINGLNHQLELNINFNQINYNATTTGLDRSGAITITNGSISGTPTTGETTGSIYNNRIKVVGDESIGIGLYEFSGNSSDLNVSSNELIGGDIAAMYIEKEPQSLGISRLDFANNAIYSNQVDTLLRGLKADVSDGTLEINAINNTVAGADEGFNFQQAFGGIFDVKFYNNLIAYTQTPVVIRNPNAADTNVNISFENNNNLFYGNSSADPDFVAGPAFIAADPMIKGLTDARLRPGSPAIEAGDQTALFFILGVPLIDADGLIRIKNGNPGSGGTALDIGAYEAGDMRVLDSLKGSSSNLNPIESAAINAENFAKIQITQNLNPNGINLINGIDNDINMGVYRAGSVWSIFSQDQVSLMDTNTAFNVWNPAPSGQNFVHTAEDAISASESFTELDRSGLNNNPNAILSVTQFWDGLYNDNPVGVFYNPFTGKWNIYNSNLEDMPWMAQFNVYYQQKSANAFVHRNSEANVSADTTYIDHPLLNNSPCAQFQITYDSGIEFPDKTGVFYNQNIGQWGVFLQSHVPMSNFARFHVLVSAEQIAQCSDIIFADSFE